MEKQGRKKSLDPVQEALRQRKDEWNKEVSSFIAGIIALKKGMNGRGDQKIGLPPSSIKEPLPTQVGSYLLFLADEFSKIISGGKEIISYQEEYSNNRKKSLNKEASWWGSRLYSKFDFLSLSREERKLRLSFLKSLVYLMKEFKNFEDIISSSKGESTAVAATEFTSFMNSFIGDFFFKFQEYRSLFKAVDDDKEITTQDQKQPQDDDLEPAFLKAKKDFVNLELIVTKLLAKEENKQILDKIVAAYEEYKVLFHFSAKKNFPVKDKKKLIALYNEMFDYAKTKLGQASDADEMIGKNQDFFKKASIKSFWNEFLLSFNKNSFNNIKIDILHNSRNARREINKLLDLIEDKSKTIDSFENQLIILIDSFIKIIDQLLYLSAAYKAEIRRDEKGKNFYLRDISQQDISRLKDLKSNLEKLKNGPIKNK